jgi:hypothetical protein
MATEKQLDAEINNQFKSSPEFTKWFLSKTKFANKNATYYWSRSDHPWGKVPLDIKNPETGENEQIIRESETDILVVFETENKDRFALHIENKLSNGHFTTYQPELYSERAKLWRKNPKYKNYTDFETVLIAPNAFYERCLNKGAKEFNQYISHEEISRFIPSFRA